MLIETSHTIMYCLKILLFLNEVFVYRHVVRYLKTILNAIKLYVIYFSM